MGIPPFCGESPRTLFPNARLPRAQHTDIHIIILFFSLEKGFGRKTGRNQAFERKNPKVPVEKDKNPKASLLRFLHSPDIIKLHEKGRTRPNR
jgi:hypothetical protein